MDIFAYAVLGLCGLLALVWVGVMVVDMMHDPIGRAVLMGYGLLLLIVCAVASAGWLLTTH